MICIDVVKTGVLLVLLVGKTVDVKVIEEVVGEIIGDEVEELSLDEGDEEEEVVKIEVEGVVEETAGVEEVGDKVVEGMTIDVVPVTEEKEVGDTAAADVSEVLPRDLNHCCR